MGLSIWHLLVVAILIFLLFGAGRVPRVMEDLAKGIKSFKAGLKDEDDDIRSENKVLPRKTPAEPVRDYSADDNVIEHEARDIDRDRSNRP